MDVLRNDCHCAGCIFADDGSLSKLSQKHAEFVGSIQKIVSGVLSGAQQQQQLCGDSVGGSTSTMCAKCGQQLSPGEKPLPLSFSSGTGCALPGTGDLKINHEQPTPSGSGDIHAGNSDDKQSGNSDDKQSGNNDAASINDNKHSANCDSSND